MNDQNPYRPPKSKLDNAPEGYKYLRPKMIIALVLTTLAIAFNSAVFLKMSYPFFTSLIRTVVPIFIFLFICLFLFMLIKKFRNLSHLLNITIWANILLITIGIGKLISMYYIE